MVMVRVSYNGNTQTSQWRISMRILLTFVFISFFVQPAFADKLSLELHCKGSYVTKDPFGETITDVVNELLTIKDGSYSFGGTPHPKYGKVSLLGGGKVEQTEKNLFFIQEKRKGSRHSLDRITGSFNFASGHFFKSSGSRLLMTKITCSKAKKQF